MDIRPVGVGVVGSGMISDIYLKNMIERFDILDVRAVCSAHMENARKKAERYGIAARDFEEMLADPSIEMIVNLTPTPVHEEIVRRSLEADKHVYTEKTMTGDHSSAMRLAELADKKGLCLGAAPDTFLGAAQQTARAAVDSGAIGEVTSFAFAANRDNAYLRSFYRFLNLPGGGVGYDYAVYYLTALVNLLGPVSQAAATVRAPFPTHIDLNPAYETFGQMIPTPNESEICAVLRMKSGVCGTLHVNNDTGVAKDQSFLAVYGTKGILYLPLPDDFGGDVRLLCTIGAPGSDATAEVLKVRHAFGENSRGVGPAEMAWAIRKGRLSRVDAQMPCHVLEVIDAIIESGEKNAFVDIRSECARPAALPVPGADEETCLMD